MLQYQYNDALPCASAGTTYVVKLPHNKVILIH